MANWTILKQAIASTIKTNNNKEITGAVLQNTLNSIVNSIGENATFVGIATPTTNPGVPDGPVLYLATQAGVYSNFGGKSLSTPGLAIFYNDKNNNWLLTKVYDFVDGRASTEIGAYEYNGTLNYVQIPIKQDVLVKKGYMFYVASNNINKEVGLFSEDGERQDVNPNTWTQIKFRPSYINTLANTNFKAIFCSPEIYKILNDLSISLDGRASTEIGAYEYNSTLNYAQIPIKQDVLVKKGYMFYVASDKDRLVALFDKDGTRQNVNPNTWVEMQFKPSYINTLANTNFKAIFCSPEIYKLWNDLSISIDEQLVYFYLPAHIYVPAGLTVEMYYKQMLLNADDFYISTTGIGLNLKRKLQLIGDNNKIGIHDLNVVCYNKREKIAASAVSKVHIVPSTIPSIVKVLPIGDSFTNSKPWLSRLSMLSSNISTVGTRSGKHEGRSGANCNFYNTGRNSYSFDTNYTGAGSNAADFNPEMQYHIGDYCKYTVSLNVANTQTDVKCVFMFTAEHIGAWDESKVVNMTTRNPFWNPFTDSFSINWYKQIQNINPDIICIWLGTNGLNLTPETNENGALGIKTLVDNIRKEDTNTPIIIVNTLFRCSQNGIGTQGNTDGYSSTSEYKHNADKKILLLEKAVYELLKSYNNVYICPVAATFDSEYNYLNPETGKVQVNPYFTNTDTVFELMESDSVHPLNYNQCADQIFGTISSIINA